MRCRNVRWTADMDEYLVKKRLEGMTFDRIALVLGISRGSAQRRLVELMPNPPKKYVQRRHVHDLEVRAKVIEMKSRGVKQGVIARIVGLRVNQVHGIWWHWRSYEKPRSQAA